MADDLTIGELGRRFEVGISDLKDDIRALAGRVDGKVDGQILALQQQAQDERHAALVEKVRALQAAREADARALQASREAHAKALRDTRRWLIASVVIPIVSVLLPLLLTKGSL